MVLDITQLLSRKILINHKMLWSVHRFCWLSIKKVWLNQHGKPTSQKWHHISHLIWWNRVKCVQLGMTTFDLPPCEEMFSVSHSLVEMCDWHTENLRVIWVTGRTVPNPSCSLVLLIYKLEDCWSLHRNHSHWKRLNGGEPAWTANTSASLGSRSVIALNHLLRKCNTQNIMEPRPLRILTA